MYVCYSIFNLLSIVIGRQGEMINKLQADSAARIQVAPGHIIIGLIVNLVILIKIM